MVNTYFGGGTRAGREADFTIGPVNVSPARGLLVCGALEEPLAPGLIRLLGVLAARRGAAVPRAELIKTAYVGVQVSDSTLNRDLVQLRRIGLGCAAFTIEGAPERSYRLTVLAGGKPHSNTGERAAQALAYAAVLLLLAFAAFWILVHRPGGIFGYELPQTPLPEGQVLGGGADPPPPQH